MDLNCRNITNINKNNDKNLFIKNLSLELVNTLNGLDGFLALINKNQMTQRDGELLNQAKYAAFILAHQIKSLNYMQELEQKSPQLNHIKFDLKDMFFNSLVFFKSNTDKNNLDIIFDYDENLPQILFGDSLKLNEIINSLLENIFILAENKIRISVKENLCENNLILINFNFIFDNKYFFANETVNNLEDYLQKSLSQKAKIKKVDINFALSAELLNQMNSKIIFSKEKALCNIEFEIPFSYQNLKK